MKLVRTLLLLLLAALPMSGASLPKTAPKGIPNSRAVLPPSKRLEALKLASRVLEPRQPTWKLAVADLTDPFYRTNFVKEAEPQAPTEPQAHRDDSDVLALAAADLHPTGTFLIGDEHYLLLGGKRLRTGDELTVTIDGIIYKITLSGIERNAYTLRLNEQELRRQLK